MREENFILKQIVIVFWRGGGGVLLILWPFQEKKAQYFPMRDKQVATKYRRLFRQEALVWDFPKRLLYIVPVLSAANWKFSTKLLVRHCRKQEGKHSGQQYWTVQIKLLCLLHSDSVSWDNNKIDYQADYVDNSRKYFPISPTVVYVTNICIHSS